MATNDLDVSFDTPIPYTRHQANNRAAQFDQYRHADAQQGNQENFQHNSDLDDDVQHGVTRAVVPPRGEVMVMDVMRDLPSYFFHRAQQKFIRNPANPDLLPEVEAFANFTTHKFLSVVERVKRYSTIAWWDSKADPSVSVNMMDGPSQPPQSPGRLTDTEGKGVQHLPPWKRQGRCTLWPVECAIGNKGTMVLIGILMKRQPADEDEAGEDDVPLAGSDAAVGQRHFWQGNEEDHEGRGWVLVDLQQSIRLDFSRAFFEDAYFVESMVVIAEGGVNGRTFMVDALFHPPRERGDDSVFPPELLGGGITKTLKAELIDAHKQEMSSLSAQADALRRRPPDAQNRHHPVPLLGESWTVFADAHLNKPEVLETIRRELTVLDVVLSKLEAQAAAENHDRSKERIAAADVQIAMANESMLSTQHIGEDTLMGQQLLLDNDNDLPSSSATSVPVGVVFMGDFMGADVGGDGGGEPFTFSKAQDYVEGFAALTKILLDLPFVVRYCHLVFVPGPSDPGPQILPKPALPHILTSHLPSTLLEAFPDAKVHLTSNPCRIRYKSRELVFFRQNLVRLLATGSLALHLPLSQKYDPSPEEAAEYVPHIVASQGHLCPVSVRNPTASTTSIAVAFDFALRIDPLPDVVCLADSCQPYTRTMVSASGSGSTVFFNAGSCVTDKAVYDVTTSSVSLQQTYQ